MRTLSAAMQAALSGQSITPIQLVEFRFDSGTQYLTDAYKTVTYGGNDYLAAGNLLGVSDVDEELAHRITTLQISLSGVNQANISVALTEDFINRDVIIYKGLLDSDDKLIVDPFNIFRGQLDDFSLSETDRTATLAWTATSEWADFERVGGRRANHQEQQVFFSGDLGFEFIDQSIKDIKWGRT